MSTLQAWSKLLGPALFDVDGQLFPVEVIDVRQSFGRTDLNIHPAGFPDNGTRWVSSTKIRKG
jgi:hypothetical protein